MDEECDDKKLITDSGSNLCIDRGICWEDGRYGHDMAT